MAAQAARGAKEDPDSQMTLVLVGPGGYAAGLVFIIFTHLGTKRAKPQTFLKRLLDNKRKSSLAPGTCRMPGGAQMRPCCVRGSWLPWPLLTAELPDAGCVHREASGQGFLYLKFSVSVNEEGVCFLTLAPPPLHGTSHPSRGPA